MEDACERDQVTNWVKCRMGWVTSISPRQRSSVSIRIFDENRQKHRKKWKNPLSLATPQNVAIEPNPQIDELYDEGAQFDRITQMFFQITKKMTQ